VTDTYKPVLENEAEFLNPIFVVGPPRSGTTLTVRALALAPEACHLGETHVFIRSFYAEASWFRVARDAVTLRQFSRPGPLIHGVKSRLVNRLRGRSEMERVVRHIFRYAKLGKDFDLKPSNPLVDVMGVGLSPEEEAWVPRYVEKYRRLARRDPGLWLRVLFKDCSLLSGRPMVLEKTPLHVFCLPLIWQAFPEAKVIATFRNDLKEVLASFYLMTRNPRGLSYITKVCAMARRAVADIPAARRSQFMSMDYEDWLADPQRMAARLFQFIGMPSPAGLADRMQEIRKTSSKYARLDPLIREKVDALLQRGHP
jgi:hypothetical protein